MDESRATAQQPSGGAATPAADARQTLFRAASLLPSGEQYTIQYGEQRAVVTEVGATLRSYQVGGRECLDTFAPEGISVSGRGQILLPWPNRIDGGKYQFGGQTHQLPLSEPKAGNASHGLVRWLRWTPIERQEDRITLGLLLHPQSGYPFTLALELTYALSERGLAVTTTARNAGPEPLPFGAGQHPYFTVGTARVDEALLRLPAHTVLTTNDRMIPTGRETIDGGNLDFRDARPIGATRLDHCFTDLIVNRDGRARVQLAHPDGAPRLILTLGAEYRYVQVYSGDTLADPDQRRRGLAIEPMTCPANAFNSGEGLHTLEPGETFTAAWEVRAE